MDNRHQLQQFVTALARDLHVDVCTLYLATHDGAALILEASFGLDGGAIGYRLPITKGLTGRVARTKRVVAVKEPETHPDYHHVAGSGEERYRTFLGIPIVSGQTLHGVLVVQTKHAHMYLLEEIAKIHDTGRRIEQILKAA